VCSWLGTHTGSLPGIGTPPGTAGSCTGAVFCRGAACTPYNPRSREPCVNVIPEVLPCRARRAPSLRYCLLSVSLSRSFLSLRGLPSPW
jgi:hypothetical protein